MIPATFNSESVYFLPYRPNWADGGPTHKLSSLTKAVRSLGGIESRHAFSDTLKTEFSFTAMISGKAQAQFRLGLKRLKNLRVLCPLWTCAQTDFTTSDTVPMHTGGLYLYYEPALFDRFLENEPLSNTYEITTSATTMTVTATLVRVPLMLGVFKDTPEPEPITSTLLTCEINFIEDGPATYEAKPFATYTEVSGVALPTGSTPKIFPIRPNWKRNKTDGKATVDVDRASIGYGREMAETYYAQNSARLFTAGFTCFSSAEIIAVSSFFKTSAGTARSFWVTGLMEDMALTVATDGTGSNITVGYSVYGLGDNAYIALMGADGTQSIHKVNYVGGGDIALYGTVAAYPIGTRIVALILARFASPSLKFNYRTQHVADIEVQFLETPDEYATPSGETISTTMGQVTRKAWLYRFVQKYAGGDLVNTYTSFENALVVGGETYVAQKINHGSITDSLDIEKTSVKIESRIFSGSPLSRFMPFTLELPLWLEIYECVPVAGAGTAPSKTLLFSGIVSNPEFKGATITAEVSHQLSTLANVVPTFLIQPTCNYQLFSSPCGLLESNWTFSGSVVSATGTTLVVNSLAKVGGGSVPTLTAGWFAYGRVWFGSGTSLTSRTVYNSSYSSPNLTLNLSHAFDTTPSGTMNFSPGCNGFKTTCLSKYANFQRFGGFPFVPIGNPSLVAIKNAETTGGKK